MLLQLNNVYEVALRFILKRKIMNKLKLTILIAILCVISGKALAYINEPIKKLTPPIKIVVPYKLKFDNRHIYTPDQYHCFMRNTLKYCHDNSGNSLNGIIVQTYDNTVAYENYRSGYQSGITSVFNQSGTLLYKAEYKKGLRNGKATSYYYNGNVEFIASYKDGALDGRLEQYDINGALIGKMTYQKGWFKEGYCKNEAKGHTMDERLHHSKYNEVIPCGTSYDN